MPYNMFRKQHFSYNKCPFSFGNFRGHKLSGGKRPVLPGHSRSERHPVRVASFGMDDSSIRKMRIKLPHMSTRHQHGNNMASTGQQHGINMASTWHQRGINVATWRTSEETTAAILWAAEVGGHLMWVQIAKLQLQYWTWASHMVHFLQIRLQPVDVGLDDYWLRVFMRCMR